jgi:AMMECR1 domain-containing protein
MALAEDDANADGAVLARHGRRLIDLARASVLHGFEFGRPLPVDVGAEPAELAALRACAVALGLRSAAGGDRSRRRARGVRPRRPLLMDVSGNAFAAAFADRRHPPLRPADRFDLLVTVMLLGPPVAIAPGDAASLRAVVPGRDGVLVEWQGGSLALFPDAWPYCPTPAEFVAEAVRRSLALGLAPGLVPCLYRFSVATAGDAQSVSDAASPP